MATPIREATLNYFDEPNKVAEKIQERFSRTGCPVLIKSGSRKGEPCAGKLVFDANEIMCFCSKVRGHSNEAYCEPFGKIIWDTINSIPEDEMEKILEDEKKEYDEKNQTNQNSTNQTEKYSPEEELKAHSMRMAKQQGAENDEFHMRPPGKAPEGLVWSYRFGKWIETNKK